MKQFPIQYHKQIGFGVLTIILILVSVVTFVTDTSRHMSNKEPFLQYLVDHHTAIMFFLIIVAIAFGFLWSNLSYIQFVKQKKDSKQILDVVILFLNSEEKEIIKHLVKNKGESSQAEISKLPGMNSVKAYRSVQKMQEKKLVDVEAHGKKRIITIKESIFSLLKE